jgi:hypothetical protein
VLLKEILNDLQTHDRAQHDICEGCLRELTVFCLLSRNAPELTVHGYHHQYSTFAMMRGSLGAAVATKQFRFHTSRPQRMTSLRVSFTWMRSRRGRRGPSGTCSDS